MATSVRARLRNRGWLLPAAGTIVVLLLPQLGVDIYWQRQVILIAIYTLLTSGLNLSFGYGGELALGQGAMFAGGAYVTAILCRHGHTDLLLSVAVAAAAAALLALVTGVPGLRLSAWSLAVTSFFLIVLVPPIVSLFPSQTGGTVGIFGILGPTLFGHALSPSQFYVFAVAVAAGWLFVMRNLVLSRFGRSLENLRESHYLVSSLGLSPFRLRLAAYALGALPAGAAGALFAYFVGLVAPDSFDFALVTSVIAASVVGGSASVWGAAVGAALLVVGPVQASSLHNYSIVAYGAFLVVVMVAFPEGIAGIVRRAADAVSARLTPRPVEPAATAEHPPPAATASAFAIDGQPLTVTGVVKRFAGLTALAGVDMTIEPGRITAIMGANGAGKTTLLNVFSGFVKCDEGEVRIGGRVLTGLSPAKVSNAGMGRTFQTPLVPATMTVLDVVQSGRLGRGRASLLSVVLRLPGARRLRAADEAAARHALDFAGLLDRAGVKATALPLGTRRLLEVVRCVAGESRVLLLDEPAAGLDDTALADLKALMLRARDAGATVVLVEHNVPFIMEVADAVHVMDLGRVIASGTPAQIRHDPQVMAGYLGTRHGGAVGVTPALVRDPDRYTGWGDTDRDDAGSDVRGTTARDRAAPLLAVRGVTLGYGDLTVVRDVSFDVYEGRITALLGRNGAGKTTLLSGLAGLLPPMAGTVTLQGRDITTVPAPRRPALGLSLVQEGKRVFRGLTVEQNLGIGSRPLKLGRRARASAAEEMLDLFPALAAARSVPAGQLSGGQQQMLAIASALICRPRVLLVDEPSSGLAPVIVEDVFATLSQLKSRGMGIVLVEQLVDEVLDGIADDVVVIDQGRVSIHSEPRDLSQTELTRFLYTA